MASITDSESNQSGLSIARDDRYRALVDERRRIALHVIARRPTVQVDELAGVISTVQGEGTTRREVEITLVHQHLPLLDDLGAIEFDRSRGRVTPVQPALDDLRRLADAMTV